MALVRDFIDGFKKNLIGVASTGAVGLVVAACVTGYEVGKNVAFKSYVHEYVDSAFERRDAEASLRADIASLETIRDKSENADVIADLNERIEALRGRLQVNQVDD